MENRCLHFLYFLGFVLIAAPFANAQQFDLIRTYEAPPPEEGESAPYFGDRMELLGDVDGNGTPDLLVTGWHTLRGEDFGVGRAYVIDAASGNVLYSLASPNPTHQGLFGYSIAVLEDIDEDGVADFVIGANGDDIAGDETNHGAAYVYSGADGELLFTLESPTPAPVGYFGSAASSAGDVNEDGISDILLGALQEDRTDGGAGQAHIFSGADGSLIRTIERPFEPVVGVFSYFGRGAYRVTDLDEDGLRDHAIYTRFEGNGRVDFVSAADGTLIDTLSPSFEGSGDFGDTIITIPDLNDDGVEEIVIGAPAANPYTEVPPFEGRGVVRLHDGATLELIREYSPELVENAQPGGMGTAIVQVKDLDDDGVGDLLFGAPGSDLDIGNNGFNAGRVYVFSTMTGEKLAQFTSPSPSFVGVFGSALALVENSEGENELFVSAPKENGDVGRIYVYEIGDGVATEEGSPSLFSLGGSHPNPFTGQTTMEYELDEPTHVHIAVYDVTGRRVSTLVNKEQGAGPHSVTWNASGLPSGMYLYHIQAGDVYDTHKVVLAR